VLCRLGRERFRALEEAGGCGDASARLGRAAERSSAAATASSRPGQGRRTANTTHTEGGRYSTGYRFSSLAGRSTFRMCLRPNDSDPYARGTSRNARVRVG
jgi:hypothetical protein